MIPGWLRLLERLCLSPDDREPIGGDLREEYLHARGRVRGASWSYARDLIGASRRRSAVRVWLAQDVRHAARRLWATPGFTLAAVLTLAVGLGTTLAIASVAEGVLLRPLPYPDADRLMFVSSSFPGATGGGDQLSMVDIDEIAARSRTLTQVAAYNTGRALNFAPDGHEPQRVLAALVAPGYLHLLGAHAARGRLFDAGDDVSPDGHPIVILTHRFWQQRLNGDEQVIGRTLVFSDVALTVAGVLSADFTDLIANEGDVFETDVFIPVKMIPTFTNPALLTERGARNFWALARLADGATAAQAAAEVAAIGETLAREHAANRGTTFWVDGLQARLTRDMRTPLLLLVAGSGFVLLLAAANVTHLLLARMSGRVREVAVRRALGAQPSRIAALITTEALVLAAAGGVAGLAVAWAGQSVFAAFVPAELAPRLADARLGWSTLALAGTLTLIVGLLLGAMSSRLALRSAAAPGTLTDARSSTTPGGGRVRRLLIAGEIALALVLLAQAHLMVGSLSSLRADDLGFDTSRLLTVQMDLRGQRYADPAAVVQFGIDLTRELNAIPGTESAFLWGPGRPGRNTWVTFPGREDATPDGDRMMAWRHTVTPGALPAAGIPLLRGRDFTPADTRDTTRVAIVSETLAGILWPGEDPIGKRLKWRTDVPNAPLLTVVGLAADAKHRGRLASREHSSRDVYIAHAQMADRMIVALVRAAGDPAALAGAVRAAVRRADASLPLYNLSTMSTLLAEEEAETRFAALLMTTYGAIALLLAAIGIYGVLSYSVSLRRRELALRAALGAGRRDLLTASLGESLRPVVLGMVAGIAAALVAMRYMESLLFGVEPGDPAALAAVAAVLLVVAVLAAVVPARRAGGADPIIALRD